MIEKRKDTALVRAAAKGGKEAFVALIDQYRQTMYATAMAVTRNEQDTGHDLDPVGKAGAAAGSWGL